MSTRASSAMFVKRPAKPNGFVFRRQDAEDKYLREEQKLKVFAWIRLIATCHIAYAREVLRQEWFQPSLSYVGPGGGGGGRGGEPRAHSCGVFTLAVPVIA